MINKYTGQRLVSLELEKPDLSPNPLCGEQQEKKKNTSQNHSKNEKKEYMHM